MRVQVRNTDCLSEDTLLGLFDGKLAPEEKSAAEEHLSSCETCLRLFAVASEDRTLGSEEVTPDATGAPDPPGSAQHISRYRVTRPIGAGGAGVVYSAWDPELGRAVALKLLHAETRAGSDGRSRVLREAQAMARLKHPNVVTVYDVGTWREQVFIAMELVEGGTLRAWQTSEQRTWREILHVYLAAGRGLAAAHAAGLVHRDFKPDNVLVAPDGRVLVTDFGLARQARDEPEVAPPGNMTLTSGSTPASTLTPIGSLVGTPAYMAPEQLDGLPATAASDLFSFCVALYEALYGARPFEGKTVFAMRASIRKAEVRAPARERRVPDWLHRLVVGGLVEAPGARPASMDALLAQLTRRVTPSRARQVAALVVLSLALLALVGAGLERSGILVKLRRLTPRERELTAMLERAKEERHEHGPAAGADAFKKAEAFAPGDPRPLIELAATMVDLGAQVPANDAVARAWLRREELTADEQTQLEILRFHTRRETDQAVARARAYWQESPGDLQRGLLLATELGYAGKAAEWLALTDELHKLPPPLGADPSIDAHESNAAREKGDLARSLDAARRAFRGFESRGDRVGMVRARHREGLALQRQGAERALVQHAFEESMALARQAHDDSGLATAEMSLASVLSSAGDLSGARPLLEEAIAIHRQIGHQFNEAVALITLSNLLRRQRDLPGAIERMIAAQSLFMELGDRRRSATTLTGLGDLRAELGDLAGASGALEQALGIQRETKDPVGLLDALVGLMEVRVEQGALGDARKLLDEARANSRKANMRSLVELFWIEAAIDFAAGDHPQAVEAARSAAKSAGEAGFLDEQAEAEALQARALLEQEMVGPAREAVTRAQGALAKTEGNIARSAVGVADGLVLAKEDPRHLARAEEALGAALDQAMHSGVAADQWEARFALAAVRAEDAHDSAGRAGLEQFALQARAQGLGLYVLYADRALARRQ